MALPPDPPSDSGFRKTVGMRIKRPISHRLQLLSQVLFDNSHAGAVETTFAEFCVARGFRDQEVRQPSFPLTQLQTSQALGECLDDFLVVVDALSTRLESLHSRGRIAVVDPNHVLAFVRAAEAFPGHMRAPHSVDNIELSDQEGFSFTLNPMHIEKIDEVGVRMFGRNRKRRAVIEEALVWFATEHGMSDVVHKPSFTRYPSISLMNLNRYFDRHVLALLTAMHPLAEGIGRFRLWSAVEHAFVESTFRLGNALFSSVRRDPSPRA